MKGQDLSQVFYDMQTIRNVTAQLSDLDLLDQCLLEIQMYGREDLERLYDKVAMGKKLALEERKELEHFYMLTNIDFVVTE